MEARRADGRAPGGSETPPRPPPPPPTVVRRVGGGFDYQRGERYTDAVAEQAAYEAYRALPPGGGQHTATDVALLAEILRSAEAEADAAPPAGGQLQVRVAGAPQRRCHTCQPACSPSTLPFPTPTNRPTSQPQPQAVALLRVLRAYERVLRCSGLDPGADTRFYRTLLRLSLDAGEACWWGRLYKEIASNCRWVLAVGHSSSGARDDELSPSTSGSPTWCHPSRRRRYGAPPEQQQQLLNVLLRCRLGSAAAEAEDEAAAAWAQEVVQASRPASPAAGGLPPPPAWTAEPALLPPQQQRATAPAAATAASWDPLCTSSFAGLPAGVPVDQQAAAAPTQHLLQDALLAWQQAGAGSVPGLSGEAKATQAPEEDAVCSWRPAGAAGRPGSAGQGSVLLVPLPPAAPQLLQQHSPLPRPAWKAAAPLPPPTDTYIGASPQVPADEQPPWAPWQPQQDGRGGSAAPSPPLKYPPIHYDHTPAAAGQGWPAEGWPPSSPLSPRILAAPPPPPVAAAAGLGAAAAAARPPPDCTPAERRQVLGECWGEWRALAQAAGAARRAADLRGTARAEEFREVQLVRRCFAAWRHLRQAVLAGVLQHMGGCARRHSFARWRAVAAGELDRRACLHYNAGAMRAALKASLGGV